jgi:hypothetical protein
VEVVEVVEVVDVAVETQDFASVHDDVTIPAVEVGGPGICSVAGVDELAAGVDELDEALEAGGITLFPEF